MRGEAGFSLTELLIAIVIVAVMGIGMVTLFQAQHQTFIRQNSGVLSTQNARAGLDMMAREIRNAGFDPYGLSGASVTQWTAGTFAFTADLNGDGDLLDPDEVVSFFLDVDAGTLIRSSLAGGEIALAEGVETLVLTYYQDAAGTPATSASNIEQVRIQLTYETSDGVMEGNLETQVAIRNNIY